MVNTHYFAESLSWYSRDRLKQYWTPRSDHKRSIAFMRSGVKDSVSSFRDITLNSKSASSYSKTKKDQLHNRDTHCSPNSLLQKPTLLLGGSAKSIFKKSIPLMMAASDCIVLLYTTGRYILHSSRVNPFSCIILHSCTVRTQSWV